MALINMNKAVFLDKDGTLIYNVPYNIDPQKIKFYEDVFDGLRLLQANDYMLVIITNQPGVALGYFKEESVKELERSIISLLEDKGIHISGFYYCPHHIEGKVKEYATSCSCRKPNPGLLYRAGNELSISLSESYMIGDILHDMEAGNRAGCRTILINNGNETEWLFNEFRVPDYIVKSFKDAAINIIEEAAWNEKGGEYERRFKRSGGAV